MVIDVKEIRKEPSYRFTNDAEITILWQYSHAWSLKWQCLLSFSILRGLRIGETVAINILDFQDNFTKLRVILEKTHRDTVLPLLPEHSEIIIEYVLRNKHTFKDGYLFPYYTSKQKATHMTVPVAEALFSKLRKKIIKEYPQFAEKDRPNSRFYRVGFHSLRRWFETRIYDKFKDRVALKNIMRYLDTRTVDTYIDPYETWKNEQTIMQDTFTDKLLTMARIQKGQCRLTEF
jgi:integrase